MQERGRKSNHELWIDSYCKCLVFFFAFYKTIVAFTEISLSMMQMAILHLFLARAKIQQPIVSQTYPIPVGRLQFQKKMDVGLP